MMTSLITIKDQQEFFTAASLQEICLNFCTTHVKAALLSPSAPARKQKLHKSAHLPNHIWERLVQKFDAFSEDYPALIYAVHHKFPALSKIHVRNSIHLKDDELRLIMEYCPASLDIHNCPTLTKKSIDLINKFGKNLECLCIGSTTQIIPTNISNWVSNHKEGNEQGIRKIAKSISLFFKGKLSSSDDVPKMPHGLLTTTKLRKLIIWGHHVTQMQQVRSKLFDPTAPEFSNDDSSGGGGDTDTSANITVDYWEYLTRDFIGNLEYLDLSSCQEILDLSFLVEAKHSLRHLYLHDVLLDYDQKTWGVLRNFSKLIFLDVSQYNELASVFANPDVILDKLVSSFPELVGLDISGTNLAGFEPTSTVASKHGGIVGLASRLHKPLQFLGLLSTHYNAAGRANIPALKIAGGKSMEQVLVALKVYMYRDNIIRKAVRILHNKLLNSNSGEFIPKYTILDILLDVMRIHMEDKHTAILSLAACFHIFKKLITPTMEPICSARVKKTFYAVVRLMEIHSQDMSLVRNGVLNLLLLITRLDMRESHALRLMPVIFRAGNLAATQSGVMGTDTFIIKAIAHILYTVTHKEEATLMKKFKDIAVPEQMCDFIDTLFKKGVLEQMPTFWIIFLKFIANKKGNEGTDHYMRYADSQLISVCFKLIRICNDDREGNNDVNHECMPALRRIQKPVIVFLANCVYNVPSAETIIVKSSQIEQIVDILEKSTSSTTRDPELLHVSCGFLTQVVSKRESYSLVCPSRKEILEAIWRTMSSIGHIEMTNFTVSNLKQFYKVLAVHDAPEAHVWALWTLVHLSESNQGYIDMIIRDGKLSTVTLLEQYSEMGDTQCVQQLKNLCNQLSKLLGKHTDFKSKQEQDQHASIV